MERTKLFEFMRNKTLQTRAILSVIAIGFLIFCGNLGADYQRDKEIEKAAQQLKDADDAQRAAAQREASRKELDPEDTRPRTSGEIVVLAIILVPIGGGLIWFFQKLVK